MPRWSESLRIHLGSLCILHLVVYQPGKLQKIVHAVIHNLRVSSSAECYRFILSRRHLEALIIPSTNRESLLTEGLNALNSHRPVRWEVVIYLPVHSKDHVHPMKGSTLSPRRLHADLHFLYDHKMSPPNLGNDV